MAIIQASTVLSLAEKVISCTDTQIVSMSGLAPEAQGRVEGHSLRTWLCLLEYLMNILSFRVIQPRQNENTHQKVYTLIWGGWIILALKSLKHVILKKNGKPSKLNYSSNPYQAWKPVKKDFVVRTKFNQVNLKI